MPDCGHPGARCAAGNFWTCSEPSCANAGHKALQAAAKAPVPAHLEGSPLQLLERMVKAWSAANLPHAPRIGDIHLVMDDGVLLDTERAADRAEIRMRRIDRCGASLGSTWGRLIIDGEWLMALPSRRFEYETQLHYKLHRMHDAIRSAPPGSGTVFRSGL